MHMGIDCALPLNAEKAGEIRAAGYDFVGRYMVPARGQLKWKALTSAEAEAINGAGLWLLSVWETSADRARAGGSAGEADGTEAARLAGELGMPESGIIYFAVDYDAQEGDFRAIADYLRGARKRTGRYEIGVYGGYNVIEAMAALGICKGYWQCVAWSGGRRSKHLTVYQSKWGERLFGVEVDINECPDMEKAGLWGGEETMTGSEIYKALTEFMQSRPVPEWAEEELREAVAMGITDGSEPMALLPRYQAAIMAARAVKAAAERQK